MNNIRLKDMQLILKISFNAVNFSEANFNVANIKSLELIRQTVWSSQTGVPTFKLSNSQTFKLSNSQTLKLSNSQTLKPVFLLYRFPSNSFCRYHF